MSLLQLRRLEHWLANTPVISVKRPKLPNNYKLWFHPDQNSLYINVDNKRWHLIYQGNFEAMLGTFSEVLTLYMENLDTHTENEDIHRETFGMVLTLASDNWSNEGDYGFQALSITDLNEDSDVYIFSGGDRENNDLYVDRRIHLHDHTGSTLTFSYSGVVPPSGDIYVKVLVIN